MTARYLAGIILAVFMTGCHTLAPARKQSQEDCLYEIARCVKKLPENPYLATLDGQMVHLQEFFDRCDRNWPKCALFAKFYYWKNEVKEIESMSAARTGMFLKSTTRMVSSWDWASTWETVCTSRYPIPATRAKDNSPFKLTA